jgi:hypothetical protein
MQQKDFWEAVLAAEGMPEELPACNQLTSNTKDADRDLLYEAIADVGVTFEEFLTAARRNPIGLRLWVHSWAGRLH